MYHLRAAIAEYSATYVIVICHKERKTAQLTSLLMRVWMDYRILRLTLVSYNNNIEIIRYNPFRNEIIHLSGDLLHACALFSYKMSNLHRHTLKVSMYPFPLEIIIKDGKLQGTGLRTFNIIAEKLNASLDAVIPELQRNQSYFNGAKADVLFGKTDFI